MTNLNELPIELQILIFNELNIFERMNLRLVNKNFLFIIDNYSNRELIIGNFKFHPIISRWPDTFKITEKRNLILIKNNLNILNSNFLKTKFFLKLDKLLLDFNNYSSFNCKQIELENLEFLNQFHNLKTLFINFETLILKNRTHLKLIKLQNLQLHSLKGDILNLQLINLELLKVDNIEYLEFIYPNTIKRIYIFINEESSLIDNYNYIKIFKNIIHLNLRFDFQFDNRNCEKLIELIQNFKQLNMLCLVLVNLNFNLTKLINYSNKIDIFINDLKIDHLNELKNSKINSYYFLDDFNLKVYLDNYYNLKQTITIIQNLNFNSWIKLIDSKIEDDFLNKLTCLNLIVVDKLNNQNKLNDQDKLNNQNKLIKFLIKSSNKVFRLILNNSLLTQSFYSNLNNYLPFLRILIINKSIKLDLNFLLKLEYLCYFKIDQLINLDEIKNLYLNLRSFKIIEFLNDDEQIVSIIKIEECDDENFMETNQLILNNLKDEYNYKFNENVQFLMQSAVR